MDSAVIFVSVFVVVGCTVMGDVDGLSSVDLDALLVGLKPVLDE